jgi:uncharacterized membrane protein
MDDLFGLSLLDLAALTVFLLAWLACEPMIRLIGRRRGALNADLDLMRAAWMRAMTRREIRMVDSQLLGHTINSASFFASANLILIAAVGGVLFGGEAAIRNQPAVGMEAPTRVLEVKFALISVCLARGLLDFIWSIRQLNYTVALVGATPVSESNPEYLDAYAVTAAEVLNPAMHGFNRGVRVYYFALAAGAWLISPAFLAIGAILSLALLAWRQAASPAAIGVRHALDVLNRGDSHPSE